MPDVMVLESQIERSAEWMRECASLVDGINFPTTNRLRVSISLLHLCIEHQTGIHLLVDHGVIGSAFALIRPQFEAYVRGVWFHRCAADDQIQAFLQGEEPPKIGPLIAAIEKLDGFKEGSLSKVKRDVWKNMNDFAHGGMIQVKARNTRDEIVSRYRYEHIAGLLQSAALLSFLASNEIAAAIDNAELSNNLSSLYSRLYG